ncbi:pyruvate dehydrogenase complex dihydrolipoamide acetyltransferase [Chlamydiifrater phoenicopteri]|uniref:pyruvate dehydrogenase complex dihydrolipoamide acetyltransferase n=1 Tax=Chlamydiifrater phoenicopteri TaxID=2681469 RepID=UPI001BCC2DC5|nr:pyruvate dehydrogenase complex dihydrolipoamide acetyltransferase [Chlamydiifrater phoenicopteri]
MLTLLNMPKLSPTMEKGTIVKWHKKEGDSVKAGDVLLEIATDKAVLEHAAIDDGFVRALLVHEKDKVSVGSPILLISSDPEEPFNLEELLPKEEKENNSAQSSAAKAAELSSSNDQHPVASISMMTFSPEPPLKTSFKIPSENKILASPLAKSIARERNLDLSKVAGSGPGGRILKRDLEGAPQSSPLGSAWRQEETVHPGSYEREDLSPMREVISLRLQASKNSIPHFYVRQKINTTALAILRKQLSDEGLKFSFNDFILRACAMTLREFPSINAGFDSASNQIIKFSTIDISVAVSVDNGLITPIVRCADRKDLTVISSEVKALAKKAKSGKLQDYEYKGGSFTLSNLGMTGITEFVAIINPPQAAILAVGGIEQEPVVINDQIVIGSTCCLTLSVDHRVIDGMEAALFMKRLQHFLENPALLLLK